MGRRSTTCLLLATILSGARGLCFPSCSNSTGVIVEGSKVPNPSVCTEFYVCSDTDGDGSMELSVDPLTCANGMYFDQVAASCEAIPSDGSSYCNMCNPCEVECTLPGSVIPNPYTCNAFYVCLDGGNFITASCDPGLLFDFEKGECAPEDEARCFDACDPCQTYCVEEGRLPDPNDCTAYLYCVPGSGTVQFQCPVDNYYNDDTKECQELTDSPCMNNCIVETTTATMTTDSTAVTTTITPRGPDEADDDRHI